jgi:hypothetical protein
MYFSKNPTHAEDGLADGHDKVSSRCASCVRDENKTKLRCILTNPCNLPHRPTNLLSQQLKMPLTDSTADMNVSYQRVAPCAERCYVCLTIGLHNVRSLITAACSIFTLSFCPPFSSHIPVTVPARISDIIQIRTLRYRIFLAYR